MNLFLFSEMSLRRAPACVCATRANSVYVEHGHFVP